MRKTNIHKRKRMRKAERLARKRAAAKTRIKKAGGAHGSRDPLKGKSTWFTRNRAAWGQAVEGSTCNITEMPGYVGSFLNCLLRL